MADARNWLSLLHRGRTHHRTGARKHQPVDFAAMHIAQQRSAENCRRAAAARAACMRVLLVTENQAAAVRVDRGQVDAVAAQQRQQKVRTDVTEVAGNDAVKVPRLCAEILQQCGKGVGSSGGKMVF